MQRNLFFCSLLFCCFLSPDDAWKITHNYLYGRPTNGFFSRSRNTLCKRPWVDMSVSDKANHRRVGVIGSGAVGLYYGARLIESGNDVSFLCRRDAEALKEKGLKVFSYEGDMHFPPESLQIYTKSEDMGVMDWVILALKSYSLPAATALARYRSLRSHHPPQTPPRP